MRRIIGFLGSLGVGVMLAAAGLAFDVATLFYSGLAIFGLMAALWLYAWASPVKIPVPAAPILVEPEPEEPRARALFVLKKARDHAAIAVDQGDNATRLRAFHEIQAAMLTVKREFGISPLKVTVKRGTLPYKDVLQAYVGFIDRIYPMLREGHIEEAKARGTAFKWTWKSEDD